MTQESLFILLVALVTWGGVFAYLVRLHFLAREIQASIDRRQQQPEDTSTSP